MDLNDGNYIKINRSILEWEWYKNINTKAVFLHMLLKAYWKDIHIEGKKIPRGSFISSLKNMAFETALTENEVRTAILHLKATGEITSKGTNKNTVFTVIKYDLYQTINEQNYKPTTNEPQPINNLLTTNEELKEGEESKEDLKDIVASGDAAPPAKPPKQKYVPSAFDLQCVDKLIAALLKEFPNSNVPDSDAKKEAWAEHIDKMQRIDKRNQADIVKVLEFATADNFWKSNIRSTKKLREKFETLILQSKNGKRGNHSQNGFNSFEQNDYDFEELERKLLEKNR